MERPTPETAGVSWDDTLSVDEIQRRLTALVAAAARDARDPGTPASRRVHAVRKRLKRIRAILRLLRDNVDADVYREESRWFRSRGRLLSPVRDAEVLVETHGRLSRGGAKVPAGEADPVREALERARTDTYTVHPPETLLDQLADDLDAKVRQWQETPLPLSVSQDVVHALMASEKRYARALRRARRSASGPRFHTLRKRVKDITYQADVLAGTPELDRNLRRRAAALGRTLGWAHDVQVYTERLPQLDRVPTRAVKTWLKRARRERSKTRKRALRRGRRFLGLIRRRVREETDQAVGSPSSP